MRAVQFSAFGKPSQLRLVELPDPQPDTRNAVVKVIASSVNPSDVKNVAGAMEGTVLPRVPGRDFSGIVEHGPADWQGAEVWGAGGDIGFARDGAHAERLLFPVAALRRKPHNLSHEQASAIGVNFLIAWLGAITYAKLEAGDEVAVIGVSGGVGGAVTQLAKARGARVIGFDRTPPAHDAPAAKLLDRFELTTVDIAAAVRDFTHGRGASLVFDAVGGPMFEHALRSAAHRGRVVVIASTGRRRVDFDLLDFYHNETQLFGADSRKVDEGHTADILESLRRGFELGTYHAPVIAERFGLEDAVRAYESVESGTPGRVVITP